MSNLFVSIRLSISTSNNNLCFSTTSSPFWLLELITLVLSRCSKRPMNCQVRIPCSFLRSTPYTDSTPFLSVIKNYLISVQHNNLPAVNESYNELLIEEEDYKTLRDSTDTNDAFDSMALASRLEKHDLLEFRRLAAHLYKKNSKWDRTLTCLSF